MSSYQLALVILAAGVLLGVNPAGAEELSPSENERRQELDQKVRILERKLELEKEIADSAAAGQPVLEAGEKGFIIRSADNAYQLKFRGYIQADSRVYFDDETQPSINDMLLRRVRPSFEGTLNKHTKFRIMPGTGSGWQYIPDLRRPDQGGRKSHCCGSGDQLVSRPEPQGIGRL